ncbi:MAG: alpha-amylase family glycosyl hydrolase [Bradymonadaceae bacterium]
MASTSRMLNALLAACLLAAAAVGCVDPQPVRQRGDWENHVDDWRDEIIYQIVVDRFANGDPNNDYGVNPHAQAGWHGGDWQGIIDRLDYLKELGVTAIWISPVVENVERDAGVAGYHGYWAQDFLSPNPHFGDLAKLRELVRKAHQRDIKVILDIVTNHVGQLFYYDINGNGQPDVEISGSGDKSKIYRTTEFDPDFDPRGIQAETSLGESGLAPIRFFNRPKINRMAPEPERFQNPDWYNRKGRVWDWSKRRQVLKGDFPGGLKDLKTTNPAVRDAMIDVYSTWIERVGFDGFRIDTIKHVEHGFWQEFAPAIRRRAAEAGKTNFLMFGESFDGDMKLNASYTKNGEVDTVFHFSQKFRVIDGVFAEGKPTREIEKLIEDRREAFPSTPKPMGPTAASGEGLTPRQMLVTFIDNHDLPRFLYNKPSVDALHNALVYLLTMNGIPCIYYGTEQQFDGGNDPFNREDMWTSNFDTSNRTFRHIEHLIDLRKKYAPLRRGDLQVRWSTTRTGDESDAGIFAFERTYRGETVLVVINTHEDHASRTRYEDAVMQTAFDEGTQLMNVFEDDSRTDDEVTVGSGGTLDVEVPARGAKIYVAE